MCPEQVMTQLFAVRNFQFSLHLLWIAQQIYYNLTLQMPLRNVCDTVPVKYAENLTGYFFNVVKTSHFMGSQHNTND